MMMVMVNQYCGFIFVVETAKKKKYLKTQSIHCMKSMHAVELQKKGREDFPMKCGHLAIKIKEGTKRKNIIKNVITGKMCKK